jgi:phosphate transport system substrate-binding protein
VTRPLFYYYLKSDAGKVAPFVNFVLSSEGQKLVLKEGYVPIN